LYLALEPKRHSLTSIDYSVFSRRRLQSSDLPHEQFDVFVSSFNDSDRVKGVFNGITAPRKIWLLHPEYGYSIDELPVGAEVFAGSNNQSAPEFWSSFLDSMDFPNVEQLSIAFDITGMMRPHLLLLPLILRLQGFTKVTFYYADPVAYVSGDSTTFAKGPVQSVGLIPGLEGTHIVAPTASDVLIIGAGYDHVLVRALAESKRSADHYLMVGLPSLQPHMYQESVFRISRASESIRDFRNRSLLFAPANDPFMTAQVLSDHVRRLRRDGLADNLYLSPVGAKTQVLGFAWFFLCEERTKPTSMLFPFSTSYSRETSRGLSSIHAFVMELEMILN
jgi:hypothetical protein